ncbi:ENTH domain-containing protein [Plasmodiophora brassicae]
MSAALKTLVSQATRDSDTPPSGYQLDQLTKASFASPVDADLLQDAVVRRLDSKSANVKWKTLRVIAYLCTNGNPSMRKSFQRRTDILRAAAGFTGPLHPLHGDAPNERVRCAAKEAMNSLFASTDAEPPQHHKSSIASQHFSGGDPPPSDALSNDNAITSVLQTAVARATSLAGSMVNGYPPQDRGSYTSPIVPHRSASGMVGFGNPAFRSTAPPSSNSFLDKVKQVFDPAVPIRSRHASTPAPFRPVGGPVNRADFDVKPARLAEPTHRQRGEVGGVWGSGAAGDELGAVNHLSEGAPTVSRSSSAPRTSAVAHAAAVGDGILETRLIDDLTAAGGVSTMPSAGALTQLTAAFESLDRALILTLLDEKLHESQHWQTQAKSLSVIEALFAHDSASLTEYFREQPGGVTALTLSNNRTIRSKADKVQTLLGIASSADAGVSSDTHRASSTAAVDLLDFGMQNQVEPQASSFMAAPSSPPTADLFASISLNDAEPVQTRPAPRDSSNSSDPLGFMMQSPPQPDLLQVVMDMHDQHDGRGGPAGSSSGYAPLQDLDVSAGADSSSAFPFMAAAPVSPARTSSFDFIADEVGPSDLGAKPEAPSTKTLDPFATAVKTVRNTTAGRADSFAFVQDIMKGPATLP